MVRRVVALLALSALLAGAPAAASEWTPARSAPLAGAAEVFEPTLAWIRSRASRP